MPPVSTVSSTHSEPFHTLFYLDPPYWQTEGYGVPCGTEEYEQMAISSVASRESDYQSQRPPNIRTVFADYHIETTGIRHTVGGGTGSQAGEVLTFSWAVASEPAGAVLANTPLSYNM